VGEVIEASTCTHHLVFGKPREMLEVQLVLVFAQCRDCRAMFAATYDPVVFDIAGVTKPTRITKLERGSDGRFTYDHFKKESPRG